MGSQARILYSDRAGRVALALAFNRAIHEGRLTVRCPAHGLLTLAEFLPCLERRIFVSLVTIKAPRPLIHIRLLLFPNDVAL